MYKVCKKHDFVTKNYKFVKPQIVGPTAARRNYSLAEASGVAYSAAQMLGPAVNHQPGYRRIISVQQNKP